MSYLMKSGLKFENTAHSSCLTPGREPKTPMNIPKNPVKVCSALPTIFSSDEKKIRNNAKRHSLVKSLCYTMHVSGVKDLDNSEFVRETLDMIGKVDREGWTVLVAEKKL